MAHQDPAVAIRNADPPRSTMGADVGCPLRAGAIMPAARSKLSILAEFAVVRASTVRAVVMGRAKTAKELAEGPFSSTLAVFAEGVARTAKTVVVTKAEDATAYVDQARLM